MADQPTITLSDLLIEQEADLQHAAALDKELAESKEDSTCTWNEGCPFLRLLPSFSLNRLLSLQAI